MTTVILSDKTNTISHDITYGDIVKCLRIINNLSRGQATKVTRLSRPTISNVELSSIEMSERSLRAFALGYGVREKDIHYLYFVANKEKWGYQKLLYEVLKYYVSNRKNKAHEMRLIPIGEVLKCFRVVNLLRQCEVIEQTGISQQRLSHVEHGERIISCENIEKLATAYNVSANDIHRLYDVSRKNRLTYEEIMLEAFNILFRHKKERDVSKEVWKLF